MSLRLKDEIRFIARLSALVNSSLNLDQVLNNSMQYVEELMDAEASSIFEVDSGRHELFFRLARGVESDTVRTIRLPMDEGIAGWVARQGKPLLVNDVHRSEHFSSRIDARTHFQTRGLIAVPVRHKECVTGVIEVLNKRSGDFCQEDLEILEVVSNQIGIAMENARLYQRLRDKFTLTCEELQKTQRKMIENEQLVALGRLSQGVAHEIRNPVMSIGGFARRLQQKLPPDHPCRAYADIILKEADRLDRLVKDVVGYANMRPPEFQQIRLKAWIEEVLDEWREEAPFAGIDLTLNLPSEDVSFPGDGWLLSVMLKNLLQNAAEAMPGGGRLSVSAYGEGACVLININDTGRGIPSADLGRIFEPFFTSKPRGSGLGLTIVHRIVHQHNGEIHVDSEPGQGAHFQIRLPFRPDDMQISQRRQRREVL